MKLCMLSMLAWIQNQDTMQDFTEAWENHHNIDEALLEGKPTSQKWFVFRKKTKEVINAWRAGIRMLNLNRSFTRDSPWVKKEWEKIGFRMGWIERTRP